MTGLEEDQEFDFDFLFEFNQSDEGPAAAAPEIKVSVEQVSETAGFGVGALEYGYEPLSNPGQLGAA